MKGTKGWFFVVLVMVLLGTIPARAQLLDLPPEQPPAVIALEQYVQEDWNLLSNPFAFELDVANTFGSHDVWVDATWTVRTIWMWNNATSKWKFWSPELTAAENEQYAQKKDYELARTIAPGEGYWLNSKYNTTLPRIIGEAFTRTLKDYAALPAGWNIIGGSGFPRQFNLEVNPTPVQPCEIPTGNFTTLWAWEAGQATWIFFAPMLEAQGYEATGQYVQEKGYIDGTYYFLQRAGFWVNKPAVPTPSVQQAYCYGGKGGIG